MPHKMKMNSLYLYRSCFFNPLKHMAYGYFPIPPLYGAQIHLFVWKNEMYFIMKNAVIAHFVYVWLQYSTIVEHKLNQFCIPTIARE